MVQIITPSSRNGMPMRYNKDGSALFGLALKTGILTFLTLGIYRFWQKTRIRQYIWSSTWAGDDTFEYTGTGLEKFLGFLVAIIVLAIYLGAIQMILFYFGLSFLDYDPTDPDPAAIARLVGVSYISFFAVLPLLYYAAYRARRYQMARTRLRGIRLGMDKGAWGYVLRALGYGLLVLISLGILTPLASFKLEKYMADRSYYGNTRVTQNGKWTALFPMLKHAAIGYGFLAAAGLAGFMEIAGLAIVLAIVGYIWFIIGLLYYRVHSFAYLMRHKVLGDAVGFTAEPRTGEVVKFYILGGLALSFASGIGFALVGAIVAAGMASAFAGGEPSIASGIFAGIIAFAGYMFVLAVLQAMSLALITQPVIAHFIDSMTITNPEALDDIQQRAAADGIDAEGFADALDVGAAI